MDGNVATAASVNARVDYTSVTPHHTFDYTFIGANYSLYGF